MTFSQLYPWISNLIVAIQVCAVLLIIEGERLNALKKKMSLAFMAFYYIFSMLSGYIIIKVMPALSIIISLSAQLIFSYVFLNRIYNNKPLKSVIKVSITILLSMISQIVITPLVMVTFQFLEDDFAMKLGNIYGPIWIGFFSILVYRKWRHKIEPIINQWAESVKLVSIQVSMFFIYTVVSTIIMRQYLANIFQIVIFMLLSFATYLYLAYKLHVIYTKDSDLIEAND